MVFGGVLLDFNNNFIIQTINANVDNNTHPIYPISFQTVVWPVLSGHYHNDWGLDLQYGLTGLDIYYYNIKSSYYGYTVVMGF